MNCYLLVLGFLMCKTGTRCYLNTQSYDISAFSTWYALRNGNRTVLCASKGSHFAPPLIPKEEAIYGHVRGVLQALCP